MVLVDSATARRGDTVRLISATSSKSHVIAFAVREEEAEVLACAEAGVAGYVACDASSNASCPGVSSRSQSVDIFADTEISN